MTERRTQPAAFPGGEAERQVEKGEVSKTSGCWSYSAGEHGRSRVRVFERRPGGAIYFERTGGGSPKRLAPDGVVVREPSLAVKLADLMAKQLEARASEHTTQAFHAVMRPASARTIRELLDALHDARSHKWCDEYRKDQELMRSFWLEEAAWGPNMERRGWADRPLKVTAGEAEDAVRIEARRREQLQEARRLLVERHEASKGARQAARAERRAARAAGIPKAEWPELPPRVDPPPATGRQIKLWATPRTRNKPLSYLKTAFEFAQKKRKWIGEADNLSDVELEPEVDQPAPAYSKAELHRLGEVVGFDLRLAVAFHIAWDTGRRIGAICQLGAEAVTIVPGGADGQGIAEIRFPGSEDKARRSGLTTVTSVTRDLLKMLLDTEVARHSRILLPNRADLSSMKPGKGELRQVQPVSESVMNRLLRDAEDRAGVPHVDGRLWHGIKRRSITMQRAVAGSWGPVSTNSGTDERTLQKIYAQHDREAARQMAEAMERERARYDPAAHD